MRSGPGLAIAGWGVLGVAGQLQDPQNVLASAKQDRHVFEIRSNEQYDQAVGARVSSR